MLDPKSNTKARNNLQKMDQPCKSGFDFVFEPFWIPSMSNNQTLEPSTNNLKNPLVCLAFDIFKSFQVMHEWVRLLFHMEFVLASTINRHRIPKRYKSVHICQSMCGLYFFRLQFHLGSQLECFRATCSSKHKKGIQSGCSSVATSDLFRFGNLFDKYFPAFNSIRFSNITTASEAVIIT